MYYDYFGFQEPPFSISPDPRFLYMSERHQDALAHLVYGVGENGGFILLTGQVGTGKTTLIRTLLSQEFPDIDIALCLHSGLSVIDFVASILDELHIDYPENPASLKPLVDALNKHLLARYAEGKQTVLIIDEGQNLSREVLEQVRLLTNLETDSQKLLRIILVGQEELQEILARPNLRQLSQRITGRYHLTALNVDEVGDYIAHRVKIANGSPTIFSTAAIKEIYRLSGGIPRIINVLCDRSLLAAYNADDAQVNKKHVRIAAQETMPTTSNTPKWTAIGKYAASALIGGVVLAGAYFGYRYYANQSAPTATITPVATEQKAPIDKATTVGNGKKPAETAEKVSRETTPSDNTAQAKKTIQPENNQAQAVEQKNTPPTQTKATTTPEKPSPSSVPKSTADKSENVEIPQAENKQSPETAIAKQADNHSADKAVVEEKTAKDKATDGENEATDKNIDKNTDKPADKPTDPATASENVKAVMPLIDSGVSQTAGVQMLLKRWGLPADMPATQTACGFAVSQGMECLSTRGGFPLIRAINRPLLLELDAGNKRTWLPIVGIDKDQGLICLKNNQPQTCDMAEIARYWSGEILVLLRKPAVSVKINPGFRGEQIRWLRQRIAIAEHRDVAGIDASLKYDKALVDRVKQFQKSRNIPVDGLIGDKTILFLHNVVVDEKTPTLTVEAK